MKEIRNLAEAASFGLFRKILPMAFVLGGLLLALPFFIIGEYYGLKFFQGVGGVVALLGVLSGIFTANEVAIRMQQDKSLLFSDALIHTLYRYLTFLCFVPFVGAALQQFLERRRARNRFTQNVEK